MTLLCAKPTQSGFSLIEILVVVAISGLLMLSLSNVIGEVANTRTVTQAANDLDREAAFVMRRLVQMISRASSVDEKANSATDIHFHLAADPQRDINKDGFPDVDNDQDGRIDEDDTGDMNGDGKPGIKSEDDDGDGTVDEGNNDDDDEDGDVDEDKPDEIHFQWLNGVFKERDVMPYDVDGDGDVDQQDTVEYILSENITSFTVGYTSTGRYPLFDVSLILTDSSGNQVTVATKIRVGGRL